MAIITTSLKIWACHGEWLRPAHEGLKVLKLESGKEPDEAVCDSSVPLIAVVLKVYAVGYAVIEFLEDFEAL